LSGPEGAASDCALDSLRRNSGDPTFDPGRSFAADRPAEAPFAL